MWGELMNTEGRSGKPPSRGKKNTSRLQAILTTPQSRREFSRDYR